jgi:hypothetical protein
MPDPKKNKTGYSMIPGSKEKDTISSFREKDWNLLSEKFQTAAKGAISGVTGSEVNIPGSIKTIGATYEDPSKKLKALKDVYMGLSTRSQSEVSKKLGGLSALLK